MYNRAYAYNCNERNLNAAPVNIEETENGYRLHLYAPALNKEQFSVTTQNDILSILYKGEDTQKGRFTHVEYTGRVNRSFDLKGKVNAAGIRAAYADGVLKIELPKTDAAKRPAEDVKIV